MRVSVECLHLVRVPASKGISGGKSVKKDTDVKVHIIWEFVYRGYRYSFGVFFFFAYVV